MNTGDEKREAKLAAAATDLYDPNTKKAESQVFRRPIDLQVLDAHILQAEGRVLELKALREDWGKLSPESQAAVFQYMQRSVR